MVFAVYSYYAQIIHLYTIPSLIRNKYSVFKFVYIIRSVLLDLSFSHCLDEGKYKTKILNVFDFRL